MEIYTPNYNDKNISNLNNATDTTTAFNAASNIALKADILSATTHLAVSAHQDDIEFMAYDGILKCYHSRENRFAAVIATDGSGSPRDGKYANCTDEEMRKIRKEEQKKAADIGDYHALAFLDLTSKQVKDINDRAAIDGLKDIITQCQPRVIYTHNPADKHDTHVATAMCLIKALRELDYMPKEFYGCEVWRGLDWVCDNEKTVFDVGSNPQLEKDILKVFDSQIAGGKRYDLAIMGRRCANATLSESHGVDTANETIFAIDLMPLLKNKTLSVAKYTQGFIERFMSDVQNRISRFE